MRTIAPQAIPLTPTFAAQTESSRQVNIVARVSGYLEKIAYHEGALVKEGEMASHQTATITSEMGYLYLYDRPSSSYGENLGRYENGEKVYILKWRYNSNYAKVKTEDGKTGYTQMSRLTLN